MACNKIHTLTHVPKLIRLKMRNHSGKRGIHVKVAGIKLLPLFLSCYLSLTSHIDLYVQLTASRSDQYRNYCSHHNLILNLWSCFPDLSLLFLFPDFDAHFLPFTHKTLISQKHLLLGVLRTDLFQWISVFILRSCQHATPPTSCIYGEDIAAPYKETQLEGNSGLSQQELPIRVAENFFVSCMKAHLPSVQSCFLHHPLHADTRWSQEGFPINLWRTNFPLSLLPETMNFKENIKESSGSLSSMGKKKSVFGYWQLVEDKGKVLQGKKGIAILHGSKVKVRVDKGEWSKINYGRWSNESQRCLCPMPLKLYFLYHYYYVAKITLQMWLRLRTLTWENYTGLFTCAQSHDSLKAGNLSWLWQESPEQWTDSGCNNSSFEDGRKAHEPKPMCNLSKLQEIRKHILEKGMQPCSHLDISAVRPVLDFWCIELYIVLRN